MIWRLTSLPELHHLTPAQRAMLIRASIGSWFEVRMWVASLIRGFALSVLLMFVAVAAIHAISSRPTGSFAVLVPFMLWPVFSVGLFQFSMNRIRVQIRKYLIDQRVVGIKPPVCLECGYAVEDAAERCPECGALV